MARARNIKPGFYLNDVLADCSVWARFIFPGLWMLADKAGRLEDRPAKIKAAVIPYDAQNMDKLLSELHNRGFIYRYSVGESKYIQIINFHKHQNPHCKEPDSDIPEPPNTYESNGQEQCARTILAQCALNENGSRPADSLLLIPSSLIPDSIVDPVAMSFPTNGHGAKEWNLLQSKIEEYRKSFPAVDVESECRKARQWCIDNQAKRKTVSGMPKFLSSWLGRAQDNPKSSGPSHKPQEDRRDRTERILRELEERDARDKAEREASRD